MTYVWCLEIRASGVEQHEWFAKFSEAAERRNRLIQDNPDMRHVDIENYRIVRYTVAQLGLRDLFVAALNRAWVFTETKEVVPPYRRP